MKQHLKVSSIECAKGTLDNVGQVSVVSQCAMFYLLFMAIGVENEKMHGYVHSLLVIQWLNAQNYHLNIIASLILKPHFIGAFGHAI
jgi:hypothetical protein